MLIQTDPIDRRRGFENNRRRDFPGGPKTVGVRHQQCQWGFRYCPLRNRQESSARSGKGFGFCKSETSSSGRFRSPRSHLDCTCAQRPELSRSCPPLVLGIRAPGQKRAVTLRGRMTGVNLRADRGRLILIQDGTCGPKGSIAAGLYVRLGCRCHEAGPSLLPVSECVNARSVLHTGSRLDT